MELAALWVLTGHSQADWQQQPRAGGWMYRGLQSVALAALIAVAAFVSLPLSRSAAARQTESGLLQSLPVTGTLPGGGTFTGTLTVNDLAYLDRQLLASGVLSGTATQGPLIMQITQNFTRVPVGLTPSDSGCSSLYLDMQPIDLDLLGLQVSMTRVSLNARAAEAGRPQLRQLLCGLAGSLAANSSLDTIQDQLLEINRLLGP
jgi:hypothetical protein